MFLEGLFGATLEDPRFTLQDAQALTYLGGEPSDSGVRVNRESANTYSPWFRGISLVSRDVAKLPLYTYRRIAPKIEGGKEGKERFREHPAFPILRRKANRLHTSLHFKMTLTAHAMSTGNGYAYIPRRNDNTVIPVSEGGGLVPMDPNATNPIRETITNLNTNEIVLDKLWYVTQIDGQQRKIDSDDVLHIRGMGFDGLIGYDVVKLATQDIGRGMATRKFTNKYFSNGAHLSVVLESPGTMPEKEGKEMVASFNRIHQGLDAAHRTALLNRGVTAKVLGGTARNAQLIETEEMNIRFVANFLGIPPHKLGAKTGESYASKEQENLDYLFQALDFWLGVWEDETFDKLLTEEEKEAESAFMEFSREKLFEADLNTKANYWRTALGGVPWAAQNEARSSFNMNPVEGGDEIKNPLNMSGAQNEPPTEKPEPEDEPDMEEEDDSEEEDTEAQARLGAALRQQLAATVTRMVRRASHAAEAAAKDAKKFMAWLDTFEAEQGKLIREDVRHVEQMCHAVSGRPDSEGLAQQIITGIHDGLLELSGKVTDAKKLPSHVTIEMARLEVELREKAAKELLGD